MTDTLQELIQRTKILYRVLGQYEEMNKKPPQYIIDDMNRLDNDILELLNN